MEKAVKIPEQLHYKDSSCMVSALAAGPRQLGATISINLTYSENMKDIRPLLWVELRRIAACICPDRPWEENTHGPL